MESPPARFLICPHCGTENLPDRETCLQCAQTLVLTIADENPWKPPTSKELAPRTFHLGTLMLVIALIGVGLGVTIQWPGLGVILTLLALPATFRTLYAVARRKRLGRPMGSDEMVIAFFASVGVVLVIALVSGIAFVVTCFPLGAAVYGNKNPFPLMIGACIVGISAAIFMAVILGKSLWPRKD